MKKVLLTALLCLSLLPLSGFEELVANNLTASPTASTVLVNGKNVVFDAYTINNNNYFKLRDLAYALNGTAKQFSVDWDEGKNIITLTSDKLYTPVGGEMAKGSGGNKTPIPTNSSILIDGNKVTLTSYNIDGNNYFMLRDLGQAFDFGVDWDGERNTIVIDTEKEYAQTATETNVWHYDSQLMVSRAELSSLVRLNYDDSLSYSYTISEELLRRTDYIYIAFLIFDDNGAIVSGWSSGCSGESEFSGRNNLCSDIAELTRGGIYSFAIYTGYYDNDLEQYVYLRSVSMLINLEVDLNPVVIKEIATRDRLYATEDKNFIFYIDIYENSIYYMCSYDLTGDQSSGQTNGFPSSHPAQNVDGAIVFHNIQGDANSVTIQRYYDFYINEGIIFVKMTLSQNPPIQLRN